MTTTSNIPFSCRIRLGPALGVAELKEMLGTGQGNRTPRFMQAQKAEGTVVPTRALNPLALSKAKVFTYKQTK